MPWITHFLVLVNVTRHPTDEWTARQILEAFPGDGFLPNYVHRDARAA